jgi:hypothetical protein
MAVRFDVLEEAGARTLALKLKGHLTRARIARELKAVDRLPYSIPFPVEQFFIEEGQSDVRHLAAALTARLSISPRKIYRKIMHDVINALGLMRREVIAKIEAEGVAVPP